MCYILSMKLIRIERINQRGKAIMGIIRSTVRVGEKPPKEVIKRLKAAARKPINYTEDAPRSSPEALKEFAELAAERNRRKKSRR